jgi:3-oxoacyl-[acyl-carrier protein] reductase
MSVPNGSTFASTALAGEVALVTGASRGIGRAILEGLVRAGATVVGTATSAAGAEAIGQHLAQLGARGAGAVLDVCDRAACDAAIDGVLRDFGKLSVLVNNAGITRDMLALRMKDDEWSEVIDTNLSSVFRMARAALRGMMKAKHGRIINISSVVGSSGNPGQGNYAAAKAGVEGLSRALAREIGSRAITVNCVAPGFIDTDMTRRLSAQQTQGLLQQIALGRLGHADEVAACVTFLASPAAAYITGATLHVNGGLYM